MKRKIVLLVFGCALLMCMPSSANEISPAQPAKRVERFALTIPEEWVQRDAGMLLTPHSGYDDPDFAISVVPRTEEPGQ